MLQRFSFQRPLQTDPVSQGNWQILIDGTKSGQYTPQVQNIGAVQNTVGYYTFFGPWVFVNALVNGTSPLTNPSGTPYVSLPTTVLATNNPPSVVAFQALPVFSYLNKTAALTGPLTNLAPNYNIGWCVIPITFFGTEKDLVIQGVYLRN